MVSTPLDPPTHIERVEFFDNPMNAFITHLLAWFGLLVLAFANGMLREGTYRHTLSAAAAHAVSCFMGVALFGVFVAVLHRWRPLPDAAQAWWVGGLWVLATVAFEFGFGRARGVAWDTLIGMYNPSTGSLWVLVIGATLLMPPLFHWLNRLP